VIRILDLNFIDIEPPVLEPGSPGATVWNDGANGPVAFGATRDEWHWLRLVGAGTFRFPVTSPASTISADVIPEPGVRRELVVDTYYRSIVPLALQAYGFEALHGSAVAVSGGVVALCADRETGKSTIAYALQRRGHDVVADDSVVLTVPHAAEGACVTVHPLPFALRLRGPTADHFDVQERRAATVDKTTFRPLGESLNLSAIVLLAKSDTGTAVQLARLGANEAFSAVLAQAHAFTLDHGDRKRAMMRSFLRLVDRVPVYRLTYPTGLEYLDGICEQVESVAATSALHLSVGV